MDRSGAATKLGATANGLENPQATTVSRIRQSERTDSDTRTPGGAVLVLVPWASRSSSQRWLWPRPIRPGARRWSAIRHRVAPFGFIAWAIRQPQEGAGRRLHPRERVRRDRGHALPDPIHPSDRLRPLGDQRRQSRRPPTPRPPERPRCRPQPQLRLGVDPDRHPLGSEYSGPSPWSEPETRIVRRLVKRIQPQITIWYHQPQKLVRAWGRASPRARKYARYARMTFRRIRWPHGTAPNWQNHRFPGRARSSSSSLPGSLPERRVARHATPCQAREGLHRLGAT